MTPHIHGVDRHDGSFAFQPVLRCYHCDWQYQVPLFYSRNGVVVVEESASAGSQRRVLLRTAEGTVQTYEHYCYAMTGGGNMNTESMLMRIESKLLNIESSLNYVMSTKDREIEKLQQTIDLLKARLKWAEEDDSAN